MEWFLLWFKSLPAWLSEATSVLAIAAVFMTAFTLIIGVWVGYFIARKRMNAIVELQFFPPKIWFKDKNYERERTE